MHSDARATAAHARFDFSHFLPRRSCYECSVGVNARRLYGCGQLHGRLCRDAAARLPTERPVEFNHHQPVQRYANSNETSRTLNIR